MRGSTVVFNFQLFSGQVVGCLATFSPADVQIPGNSWTAAQWVICYNTGHESFAISYEGKARCENLHN